MPKELNETKLEDTVEEKDSSTSNSTPGKNKKRKTKRPGKNGKTQGKPTESTGFSIEAQVASDNPGSLAGSIALSTVAPYGDTSESSSRAGKFYWNLRQSNFDNSNNPIANFEGKERLLIAEKYINEVNVILPKYLQHKFSLGDFSSSSSVLNRIQYIDYQNQTSLHSRGSKPQIANFASILNISGYIPDGTFKKISSVVPTSSGYELIFQENEHPNQLDVFNGKPAVALDTTKATARDIGYWHNNYDRVETLIESSTTSNILNGGRTIKLNASSLGNSFNKDINSNNYFASIRKIVNNMWEYVKADSENRSPTIITDVNYIFSTVSDIVNFSTFMYIFFDSIHGVLGNISNVAKKTGMIDGTVAELLNIPTKEKEERAALLNRLLVIFDKIPVNTEVISTWNSLKFASKLKDADLADEDNTLVAPHFSIAGHFNPHEVVYATLKPHAAQSAIKVPIGSPFEKILSLSPMRGKVPFASEANAEEGKPGNFFGYSLKNGDVVSATNIQNQTWNTDQIKNADWLMSYVRCSSTMLDLLEHLLYNSEVRTIYFSYLEQCTEFWDLLKKAKAFDGTIFKYTSIPEFDFKTEKTADVKNFDIHANILRNMSKSISIYDDVADKTTNLSTLPFVSKTETNIRANGIQRHVIFSQDADKVIEDLNVKGLVVNTMMGDNDFANAMESSFPKALESVVLTSSIIIPFSGKAYTLFSHSISSPAGSQTILFTSGKNDYLFYPGVMFEFCRWRSSVRSQFNRESRLHISNFRLLRGSNVSPSNQEAKWRNVDYAYYYTSDKYHVWSLNESLFTKVSEANQIGLMSIVANFWPFGNGIPRSYDLNGGYSMIRPTIGSYRTRWCTEIFNNSSIEEYKYGSFGMLSPADVKIES